MRQQDQLRQVQRQLEEQKNQIDQSLENEEKKKQREEEPAESENSHQTTLDMIEDYRRRGFITDLETQLQIEQILAADQDPTQFIQLSNNNHYFTEEEDASQQEQQFSDEDEDLYAQTTGPDRTLEHALYQAQTHLAQTEFLSQANREQVLHQFN